MVYGCYTFGWLLLHAEILYPQQLEKLEQKMQVFIKNQEVLYYQFEKEKNPAEVHQETIQ